ncbi:MAG: CocE/NonD family hydrolase [Rubrivivax sp.]|nr:MAG: CocE/NonD family hydrolase [Rubrivivax sp.]
MAGLRAWLLCMAVALTPIAQAQRISKPGEYAGYSPRLYDRWVRSSVYVPVRDGTRLAVDIYRPATTSGQPVDKPYPVLWTHTPYQRAVRAADGSVQLSGDTFMPSRDLVLHGYVVAIVDTRGKGASFGTRRGMQDSTEGRDAYDMTEWLARQPWSDGQVGMLGCSYVGDAQNNAAATTPPSLKAIFPGASSFNRYDFVSRGGLTAQFHTRPEDPRDQGAGTLPVDADPQGLDLAAAREGHVRNTAMASIWKDIPFRDDWSPLLKSRFWEETSLSTYRNAVEMRGPVMYRWTGWADEFSAEQFIARANLKNVVKLLIGPEGHCRSDQFNLFAEHLRYFDRYLKGVDNGIDREPSIHYYTYNAEPGHEWRSADSWPLPGTRKERYFLSAEHGLASGKPGRAGVLRFEVDYAVVKNDGKTLLWPVSQFGHGLSYVTPPFTEDMQLTGHAVVSLWISTTATDGDVFAYLEEVHPDGSSALRAHGRLRASHRKLGTPPHDYLGLPWHRSFREDHAPMRPGVPEELRFDLLPTSTLLRKGDRLRLVITGADPRQRSVPADAPPTVSVHSGGTMASYIELPFVPLKD